MSDNTFTATVEENLDTGEMIIPLPQEMIEKLGWTEDDEIKWTELPNGEWSLSKLE